MAWTDLSGAFGYGTKLTSAQMQNLRDNVSAVPAGESGAPRIVNAAVASGTITANRIACGSAGSTRLVNTIPSAAYYQVLGLDGNWHTTCSPFDSTGGGGG